MTTKPQVVTATAWINIVDTLSLTVGVRYTGQNVGPSSLKYLENPTTPAATAPAKRAETSGLAGFFSFTVDATDGFWVRAFSGTTTIIIDPDV